MGALVDFGVVLVSRPLAVFVLRRLVIVAHTLSSGAGASSLLSSLSASLGAFVYTIRGRHQNTRERALPAHPGT